jgi:hypothetical protein
LVAQLASSAAPPRVRYVAPPGFASIDFVEAQLRHAASSNASVSAKHDLIVQGKRAGNGLRAVVSAVPGLRPEAGENGPIMHLWLVPGVTFDSCEAGRLEIAAKVTPARVAELRSVQRSAAELLNRAIGEAEALTPHIVQYAPRLPEPDARSRTAPQSSGEGGARPWRSVATATALAARARRHGRPPRCAA